jgi:hypothetical protein
MNVTSKTAIVKRLSENAVLLPSLIGDALAANDRIKLSLSLLQEAALQAQMPDRKARHFEADTQATRLEHLTPDSCVDGARLLGPGRLLIPGVRVLLASLAGDLAAMFAPLQAADNQADRSFVARVEAVTKSIPAAEDDQLDLHTIDELPRGRDCGRNSGRGSGALAH